MTPSPDPLAPSDDVLDWVARAVGSGATVDSVRRLENATSSAVHAIDVTTGRGARAGLVLRRYVDDAVLASEPRAIERETVVLEAVAALPVRVPRVVATDPEGAMTGVPALLMTRLPGRPRIRPRRDREQFLGRLAQPLPELHALPVPADPSFPTFRRYSEGSFTEPPPWSRHPDAWRRAIEVHAAPWTSATGVVIHRDYHALNVLWRGSEITGIVDWAWGCRGPAAVDVAHCRLNLALALSVDAADRFLRAWQTCAGVSGYDPSWDLRDAVDALGDLDDTRSALRRLDELVARSAAEV